MLQGLVKKAALYIPGFCCYSYVLLFIFFDMLFFSFFFFGDNLRETMWQDVATALSAFSLISLAVANERTQEAQEFMTPCGFIDASVKATLAQRLTKRMKDPATITTTLSQLHKK